MRSLLIKEGTYQRYYERTAALKENNTAPAMSFEEFRELEKTLLPALMSTDRSNAEFLELNSTEQLKGFLEGDTFLHLQAFLRHELKLLPSTRVKMRAVPYIKRLLGLLNQLGLQRMEFYIGCHADCIELAESLMGWTVYTEFARTHVDPETLGDVDAIVRAVTEPIVQQMKHGRWSFIADMVSPSQGDFVDVFFHNKRFSEQRLRSVFDTVAMNASLLHNWMALAGANAQIAEEEWRDHVAVRVPPLFAMMPLYDRDYTVAAKYGAIGTLLGAAAVRLFVTRLPHTSAARTKILQKLNCFAPSRVSPPGSSPRVSQPAYLAAVVDLVWEAFASADGQVSPAAADLRSYTNDVTFFVVLCHLCAVCGRPCLEFSCTQVAKNSRAFARVFKCEVGRPMNPLKKCDFFSYT
ncbi:hypothetical protein HPB50_014448 [Hyalomma asiaticum]|uniref:Uncharacterized protein n=1 Tax=Hyalomma asiaticum TaxID=266040 RepID=A0ACB7T589_HYAAI|nr:hypothetical protein HPB50_014448 [Hyalomma asiaticum]